jgi:hypothetical protein
MEMVAALGVLAVATLTVVGLFLTAQSGTTSTHETEVATHLAEQYLDELKRGSFSTLEGAAGSSVHAQRTVDGRAHDLVTEVERLSPDATTPDYRVLHLICTVSWQGKAVEGKERQARSTLETDVSAAGRY